MDEVVEIAKSLGGEGFDDMIAQDIQELLVEEEIYEAGLVEMISGIHDNSEDDSTAEDKEVKKFTLQNIKKGLGLAEQLESYFLNEDPSNERSTKFKRELHKCLAPYKEIYTDLLSKSKQCKITYFLQKVEHRYEHNAEKCSENKNILQKIKCPRLTVLSADEENIV
ncbi:uncharacterized protein LOC111630011 [Centruroides sculpturatus]|uniref:uncharacterized protein LOC111630011 n=1 Tax=Centruroides sculpturatus TaxID=218467 RepID=UPI000C6DCE0D|nr:uncharacterized protein LOC111630011 [Centruroides sculpturatus]